MKQSSPSGPRRVDRGTAEAQFANRLSVETVQAALASPDRDASPQDNGDQGQDAPRINYRTMHRLARGTFEGEAQPLLEQISTNFTARRQFRDILATVAVARQEQQAAAASFSTGAATTRPGKMFDLIISPSSRNDGILYLQVIFHESTTDDILSGPTGQDAPGPTMLFADRNGQFAMIRLPEIMDGTVQIMLDQSHDIVQAFRDPETEFFIR